MLRHLELGNIRFKNDHIIDALLAAPLVVLNLEYCRMDETVARALKRRGHMPHLKALTIAPSGDCFQHYIDFLAVNAQISKLNFRGEQRKGITILPHSTPGSKVLPLLASSFRTITSLRIGWHGSIFRLSASALTRISEMKTLEKLCLGVGTVPWRYRSSLADHDSIQTYLSRLPRLNALAFTGNYYKLVSRVHYSDFTSSHDISDDTHAGEQYWKACLEEKMDWEDSHKARMICEAEMYSFFLPKLDWIYIGQHAMDIAPGMAGNRKAVPLHDNRDGCAVLLKNIFG